LIMASATPTIAGKLCVETKPRALSMRTQI
jgi:hypothetical protein